jgi:hypothetical protein
MVGEQMERSPQAEFVATNLETATDHYFPALRIDVTKPMYISASNLIIQHMLRMCSKLEDMNLHLTESYVFTSRIRWELKQQGARRRNTRNKTLRRK